MKKGFDNDKYLADAVCSISGSVLPSLTTSSIWSLAASCLTTTMRPACCRASSPTPSCRCCCSSRIRRRSSSSSALRISISSKVRGDYRHHLRCWTCCASSTPSSGDRPVMWAASCITQYTGQPEVASLSADSLQQSGHPRYTATIQIAGYPGRCGPHRQRRGLRQERLYRDRASAGGRHRPRPRQRQDGDLSVPAVPRVQARRQGRAMPSLRPSPSGTCRSSIRSTWPTRPPPPT